MFPGIAPQLVAPQVPSSVFIGSQWNDTTQTSYTFPVDIGAPANNRVIVLAVGGNGSGSAPASITGTIAGVPFTVLKDLTQSGQSVYVALIAAVVPASAGSGVQPVVINTGATPWVSAGIGAYRCLNLKNITPTATLSSLADPGTGTLNVSAQGLAFAVSRVGSVAPTVTWTGVTQDFNVLNPALTRSVSGGSYRATAAEVGRTITATRTAGGSPTMMVAASLR